MATDEVMDAITSLRRRMYELLDQLGAMGPAEATSSWAPPTDVEVRGNQVVLTVELPGVRRDDVQVEAADNVLTVSGRRTEAEDGRYLRRERPVGEFRRSFALPWKIDADKVSAKLERGVLTITVPRAGVTKVEVGA